MILYDQNHNFIGMSSETLSYLGYEDLSDFSSQHSDFANLLVNKEGYIYKFQNFSWIDFILYSGSPNKSALLQLKSGEPLEIKLSVKEVHLLNELGGNSKFYSIRILSDNFVNIAAKTDASITKQSPPKNAFNLNSLIDDTTPPPVEESNPVTAMSEEPSSSNDNDFVLNFPSTDSLKEPEETVTLNFSETKEESFISSPEPEEETASNSENDFKLNLSETLLKTQEIEEPSENSLKEEDFSLNFLKDTSETAVEKPVEEAVQGEVSLDFIKPVEAYEEPEQKKDTLPEFKLKHIDMQEEKVEEENEGKITLNFLNTASSPTEEETLSEEIDTPLVTEEREVPNIAVNLDFLNSTVSTENESTESPANKEQIITQIQNDIKEIDDIEEEVSFLSKETQEIAISNEDEDIDAYLFNKNEVKKEKKSFTKTLKSLFADTSTFPPQEQKEDDFVEVFSEPEATLQVEEKASFLTSEISQEQRFPTLAALGLEKEEEDDLISEFITDTKANIRLFKDFYQSKNIDQAEYTLIKMQSSANILNLNDIIITLANVKQSCLNSDSETIEQLVATLEKQVSTLESYLERETV